MEEVPVVVVGESLGVSEPPRGRSLDRQRRERGRRQRGLGERDQDSVSEDGGRMVNVGMGMG